MFPVFFLVLVFVSFLYYFHLEIFNPSFKILSFYDNKKLFYYLFSHVKKKRTISNQFLQVEVVEVFVKQACIP